MLPHFMQHLAAFLDSFDQFNSLQFMAFFNTSAVPGKMHAVSFSDPGCHP